MNRDGDIILEVNKVWKTFGGLTAVNDVSYSISKGKIFALIGPNGAGKTTLFNVISGIYLPDSGVVKLVGENIVRDPPHIICKKGISRTFQIVRPFLKMTSLENVMVGAMFGSKKGKGFKEASEKAQECLDFVNLADKRGTVTGNLTLANRKMVELAKALANEPKIVLIDEILAGLNPTELESAMNLIRRIRDDLNITVFWVEHVMDAVIRLAEHIIVLNYGEKIAEGTPRDITHNQKVIDAYLGEEYTF